MLLKKQAIVRRIQQKCSVAQDDVFQKSRDAKLDFSRLLGCERDSADASRSRPQTLLVRLFTAACDLHSDDHHNSDHHNNDFHSDDSIESSFLHRSSLGLPLTVHHPKERQESRRPLHSVVMPGQLGGNLATLLVRSPPLEIIRPTVSTPSSVKLRNR